MIATPSAAAIRCDQLGEPALALPEDRVVGVAQVDGHHRASGDDVHEVRVQRHRADGTDLRAAELEHQVAHRRGDRHRRVPGVVAQRHRGRARVVRLPRDRELLPRDALHALDRADGEALCLEDRALLDVQLDERVRHDARARMGPDVLDPGELVADARAVDPHDVEGFLDRHAAGVDEAAHHVGREARAFLVREERDAERAAGDDVGPRERLDQLEPGEHPEIAVVATAGTDRVDVGADEHGRHVFATGPPSDDVADRVDLHREIQVAHPRHDEVPARPILVGEGKAGAAPVAGRADVGERPQAVLEPRPVDLQRSPRHSHRRRLNRVDAPSAGHGTIVESQRHDRSSRCRPARARRAARRDDGRRPPRDPGRMGGNHRRRGHRGRRGGQRARCARNRARRRLPRHAGADQHASSHLPEPHPRVRARAARRSIPLAADAVPGVEPARRGGRVPLRVGRVRRARARRVHDVDGPSLRAPERRAATSSAPRSAPLARSGSVSTPRAVR